MQNVHPSLLLKGALTADALVSGGIAGLQLFGSQTLASWLALPQPLLNATGAFLVPYAVVLLGLARSATVGSLLIWVIVLGNVGWAFGCIALLAFGALITGYLGTAFLLVQAAVVLMFAVLEYKGLQTSASSNSSNAGVARSAITR